MNGDNIDSITGWIIVLQAAEIILAALSMVMKKLNAKFISNIARSVKSAWNSLVESMTPASTLAFA